MMSSHPYKGQQIEKEDYEVENPILIPTTETFVIPNWGIFPK